MDSAHALINLAPALRLFGLAALVAMLPLTWWWLRQRGGTPSSRLTALGVLTAFLTFDLIVFGSFTRLTDSGLGCPDWPGCYGAASPFGALSDIQNAQLALPSGPVTVAKAWIEMVHRYLAMVVGALILVAALASWRWRKWLTHSPWWSTLTLVWVVVQGAFGKYTVTLKLYPAVVTLHLLGGLVLLSLLVLQCERSLQRTLPDTPTFPRRSTVAWVLGVLAIQIALGGWVSTNYAVLACQGFPSCNGQAWPMMDMAQGFAVFRPLGRGADGAYLPFSALVAVHMVHRLFAVVASAALVGLVWRLWLARAAPQRRYAQLLAGLLGLQVLSGLSNVVLGWPIAGALAHSAGAAALVATMVSLLARSPSQRIDRHQRPAAGRPVLGPTGSKVARTSRSDRNVAA